MRTAAVRAIASFFPNKILANEELASLNPSWSPAKILEKTGVRERRIAAADETAGDLALGAARRLFGKTGIDAHSIDFLLLCTQAADYILPSTSCFLQDRLGLRRSCGALDFSLGCSGFVYGLALAKGLIESGAAQKVLLLTADTYSKFIHPEDHGVRSLFGDGAAATLIELSTAEHEQIGPFVFGTDGRGAENLIIRAGGARLCHQVRNDPALLSGDAGSPEFLRMDGAEIMAFALEEVPKAVDRLLEESGSTIESFDAYIFHQASALVLEKLRNKLKLHPHKFVVGMEYCGNTVSSSIPIAMEPLLRPGEQKRRALLVGFGVGYSLGATSVAY